MDPVSFLLFLRTNAKLIAFGLAMLAVAYSSHWATAKVYKAEIGEIQSAQAEAEHQALLKGQETQRAADKVAWEIADRFPKTIETIITKIVKIKEEIPIYVKDDSSCITYGLVRLHDAAAYGIDPATLALPSGVDNDTCAPVKWTALAGTLTGNYGNAALNAAELTEAQNALTGFKRALDNRGAKP